MKKILTMVILTCTIVLVGCNKNNKEVKYIENTVDSLNQLQENITQLNYSNPCYNDTQEYITSVTNMFLDNLIETQYVNVTLIPNEPLQTSYIDKDYTNGKSKDYCYIAIQDNILDSKKMSKATLKKIIEDNEMYGILSVISWNVFHLSEDIESIEELEWTDDVETLIAIYDKNGVPIIREVPTSNRSKLWEVGVTDGEVENNIAPQMIK